MKTAEEILKKYEINSDNLVYQSYTKRDILKAMEEYASQQCQKRDEIIKSSFDRIDQYRKASKDLLGKIKKMDELIKTQDELIEALDKQVKLLTDQEDYKDEETFAYKALAISQRITSAEEKIKQQRSELK
jgi:hypothetical protein